MYKKGPCLLSIVNSMAVDNNEKSYKELFTLLFNPILKFSLCLVKSRELAEEVASDVMFILWSRRAELMMVENIQAYAFVIARNLSLNALKKKLKMETVSIDELSINISLNNDTPEQILISSELSSTLESAINLLPPRAKLVFKLIKEDGFSYREVAEILEISVKTVDAHLVAALKKISMVLAKEFNLT